MGAPQRRWGWHQLDRRWAERLVAEAELPANATVLDIGAGLGALTGPLLDGGARVIAVEAHKGRARTLTETFGDDLVVVRADAGDLRLPRRPYHVVANPPFAVTTTLLKRLLQPGSRLRSAHLVLQEQAARRWVGPTAPGVQRWGHHFRAELGPRLPRSAFRPPPHVPCRLLRITSTRR